MFVWNIEANAESRGSPETVFRLWTEVANWPHWNQDIAMAKLEGPFASSTRGVIELKNCKPVPFTIAHVEQNKCFSIVVKKWFTTVVYRFQVHYLPEKKVHITWQIVVGGLCAPIWRYTWGKKLQKSLPLSLRSFVDVVQRHV
jgi:hypothetical protein